MLRQAVRSAMVTAATVGLLATQPPPTPNPGGDLWGSVSCSETPSPACGLGAGSGGASPRVPDPGGPGSNVSAPQGGRGGGRTKAEPASGVRCSYQRSDFQPPPGGVATVAFSRPLRPSVAVASLLHLRPSAGPPTGGPGSADGAWYLWRCSGEGWQDAVYRAPTWIPNGQQAPGAAGPTPAELAEIARRQLRLPDPVVAASPVGVQLVNLPTWLWLGGDWAPVEATAAVPGVSVTARAVPKSVRWVMGDGSVVVCRGPGTPYAAGGDPAAPSPDCGHTYRVSSAGRPGEAFAVSVAVSWTVTWAGAGAGGTFPGLTTTGGAAFRVAESQALVTGGG